MWLTENVVRPRRQSNRLPGEWGHFVELQATRSKNSKEQVPDSNITGGTGEISLNKQWVLGTLPVLYGC
jgi:hypothetical protein